MDSTLQQQAVPDAAAAGPSDAGSEGTDQAFLYDEVFPALPESKTATDTQLLGQWNQKMRIGSSVVTQVFHVPFEERRDQTQAFGESDSSKICAEIMTNTQAHIEMSSSRKDQSLTFLVTGKHDAVQNARREILKRFQTQANITLTIPKEHHRFILGKAGAKLSDLQKETDTVINVPKVVENSDKITIIGTKESIEKAAHEIQQISDEQSKQAFEKIEIPKKFHPFITGGHMEKLNKLIAETGANIRVPALSVMTDTITILGEKDGVQKAKEKIEGIYKEMKKRCSEVSVVVNKAQHRYVIGYRGNSIAEILQQTGVSVEMPSSDSNSETITLRGPQEKLGEALTKVYEKANSIKKMELDAPEWIHKYLIGRKGANIKKVTQDDPEIHVAFTNEKIQIEAPPDKAERTAEELEKMVSELQSQITFDEIDINTKFHKHIIGKGGSNVNRIKEQTGVLINIPANELSSKIRIEGNIIGVTQAKQELLEMVHKLENERERELKIENRFHGHIIGAKGEKIREIRDRFNQVQIVFPEPGENSDSVKIRGPKEDVDACYDHLRILNKELILNNYTLKVPTYKQFHRFIIGKGGSNIKKIREETNTRIALPPENSDSDFITITGTKMNVEDARERINKIMNEQSNIVEQDLIIPHKFHNSMIGAGGRLIQSIMDDCGGVSIKFPSAMSGSDKVTIRGPKEDVAKAKKQLVEMSNEKQLSSHTVEVRAKPEQHKFLIGRQGANIKKIRDSTGARIVFPAENDPNREVITIIGKKEACEKARKELESVIKTLNNVTESEMQVDPKYHRHFVARRGDVLRQIGEEFGGVMVSFPRSGVNSDRVTLKGAKNCVEEAKQRISEIVEELKQMVTIECNIPQKFHRTVMGAKGHKVQNITSTFDVQIKFPDKLEQNGEFGNNSDASRNNIIRITGKKENCESAKQELLSLVPVTVDVTVPFDLHRYIIGQKGKDVREMMERFDVNITVPAQEEHSDIIKISGAPSNVEEAKNALLERVEELNEEKRDREARQYKVEIEVDPEYHPKIIGRRGAVISNIRDEYDVQINFRRKGDPDEQIITITGYEKNAQAAKDAIMKIVNELDSMVKEEVKIDRRVHKRLIGRRGMTIRKIMDEYKVDIRFVRDDDLVVIMGTDENVQDCKYHLLNLEEEYLQDIADEEYMQQYTHPPLSTDYETSPGRSQQGFVVTGAPWEQSNPNQLAPNVSSNEEFPSFGEASTAPGPVTAWGPRH